MYKDWDLRWQLKTNCRQTFALLPCTDRSKSKEALKLNRRDLGVYLRYVTGHCHLRRHNNLIGIETKDYRSVPPNSYKLHDPDTDKNWGIGSTKNMCRLCKLHGTEETPFHLLTECLRTWALRRQVFGFYTFEGEEHFTGWRPKQIVEFFSKLDLENKEE